MKNAKLKIKKENRKWRMTNDELPMFTGGWALLSEGAGQAQGLKFKVQSDEPLGEGRVKFEDLRLKTTFWFEEHAKAWTPYGECPPPRPPSIALARQVLRVVDKTGHRMRNIGRVWKWTLMPGVQRFHSKAPTAVAETLWRAKEGYRSPRSGGNTGIQVLSFGFSWVRRRRVAGRCSLIPTVSHLFPHFPHKNIFGEGRRFNEKLKMQN